MASKSKRLRWCPLCKNNNTEENWDKATLEDCVTEEMINDFVSISDTRSSLVKGDYWYKCPKCKTWHEEYKIERC